MEKLRLSSAGDRTSSSMDSTKCCFSTTPSDYEVYIQMGHACNGMASIYIGKHTPSKHFVAIRQVPLDDCSMDLEDLQNEIVMHRNFNNEYILNYLSTFVSESTLWMVMPLQGYGSCMDMLQAHFRTGLPELVIALILKQVLHALVYLHDRGVIHRSLRSSHILVSETGRAVITGLRNCYKLEKRGELEDKCWHFPTNSNKAISYYSPELLMQVQTNLGVVACELANGHTPFSNLQNFEILYEKLDANIPRLLDASTATFNPLTENDLYSKRRFSVEFHEFAEICCIQNPNSRPSAEELLKHEFFNQTKKVPYEELPNMLQPLTPLTDSALEKSENTAAVSSLTHDLANAGIAEFTWNF
ncbi:STE20-related kinase adapter protein alpha-like isoform X2 [Watersipora subatra]|uniref:STE20-related kinase adapter protein alpha-like isoform X2 n=1 Tax=Watersipora subatra TaxID=2589382 RepID=UPI00355AEDC7